MYNILIMSNFFSNYLRGYEIYIVFTTSKVEANNEEQFQRDCCNIRKRNLKNKSYIIVLYIYVLLFIS